jgi:AraC-like DNA-binding protein
MLSLLQEPLPWQMTVINIFGMLTIWAGVFASALRIVRYKKRLVRTVSNLEKTKLAFITQFVLLGFILTSATTVLYLSLPQYQVEYLYLPCLITLIYFFVLFYTFRHHAIFTPETYDQFLQDTLPASEEMLLDELKLVAVGQPELRLLAERIVQYLLDSEVYTNPDLTITMLARQMNTSTERISTAINKEMNKNFFDLINEKRVEKAKGLLMDKINLLTVEAIAYEAGFNSRASFYRAFKKCTGLTPSGYLNQMVPVFLPSK